MFHQEDPMRAGSSSSHQSLGNHGDVRSLKSHIERTGDIELLNEMLEYFETCSAGFSWFNYPDFEETMLDMVYRDIKPDDYKLIQRGTTKIFFTIQWYLWVVYMLYLSTLDKVLVYRAMPKEDLVHESDFRKDGRVNEIREPIVFYSLSQFMELLLDIRSGKVELVQPMFEQIQLKIGLFMRNQYDMATIDLPEYKESRENNKFVINKDCSKDIFCILCDIMRMKRCQNKLDGFYTVSYCSNYMYVKEFLDARVKLVNKDDFVNKCNLFIAMREGMLFDEMRIRRIKNIKQTRPVDIISHSYSGIETVTHKDFIEHDEIYNVIGEMLFNLRNGGLKFGDFISYDFDFRDFFSRSFDPLDKIIEYRYFIMLVPTLWTSDKAKYFVIDRKNKSKVRCNNFLEALAAFLELSKYIIR